MTPATPNNLETVADLWYQWLEVVEKIVDPELVRRKLSPQEYRNLHSALVKECKVGGATDDELQSKLEQIQGIVAPWVTYDSLATAERRFLSGVLKQAEPINTTMQSLAGNSKKTSGRSKKGRGQLLVWLLAFGIGLGGGMFVIFADTSFADFFRIWLRWLQVALSRFTLLQIFGVASAVMLLSAAPLMYRTKKS